MAAPLSVPPPLALPVRPTRTPGPAPSTRYTHRDRLRRPAGGGDGLFARPVMASATARMVKAYDDSGSLSSARRASAIPSSKRPQPIADGTGHTSSGPERNGIELERALELLPGAAQIAAGRTAACTPSAVCAAAESGSSCDRPLRPLRSRAGRTYLRRADA